MTLIELMVVVVILTTLVAGVLPLVSPNNDARKIREASRGLKTFLMMAQAEAARTGRPVGVGFRESSIGSGAAIEAYQLAVPPEYSGGSPDSRVGVQEITDYLSNNSLSSSQTRYGPTDEIINGNDGEDFRALYGARLYVVTPKYATTAADEPLPPGMIRVGDVIKVAGKQFKIVDDKRNAQETSASGANFLDPRQNPNGYENRLICVWLDEASQGQGKVPPLANPSTGERYIIERQPASDNALGVSAQPSFQLPAGMAIDFNGSGIESGGLPLFFIDEPGSPTPTVPNTAGVMFSPNGGIESVWYKGTEIKAVDRVFFLVGRGENTALGKPLNYDETNCPWYVGMQYSDDQLQEKREQINWLNPESRWLMIEPAGNRLKVVENAVFDPRTDEFQGEMRQLASEMKEKRIVADVARIVQIEHAHELAHGLDHDHGGGQ
ncbi:hypothetical protein Pr1d_17700 [Bythopirellula goksoeyrii]|uniref:Uncharacterized protein n=2 Tax=Bythopirellula goksoeyrii TaxID=1400387 RepID=A0A5B9QA63_9BACT|nr:hypothetical protein Pr1d_17700 [Bythopirellula goksoeyrii]